MRGELPARDVSDRVLQALAGMFGITDNVLREAGAALTSPAIAPRTAQAAASSRRDPSTGSSAPAEADLLGRRLTGTHRTAKICTVVVT